MQTEIIKIKISDELMTALVAKFFTAPRINAERFAKNAENSMKYAHQPWHPGSVPMQTLGVSIRSVLDIPEETARRLITASHDEEGMITSIADAPYVSLVSDNSLNELRAPSQVLTTSPPGIRITGSAISANP